MSFQIRARKMWPCNRYAQYLWQFSSILEDMNELLVAYREATRADAQLIFFRYVLVGLYTFDELAKRFQDDIKAGRIDGLSARDRGSMDTAFSRFHRTIQRFRRDLSSIRHTLAAHRGLPDKAHRDRFKKDFEAWGEWESTLAALESRCHRDHWEAALEAAFELTGTVAEVNAGQWYSADANSFQFYMPIKFVEDDSAAGKVHGEEGRDGD